MNTDQIPILDNIDPHLECFTLKKPMLFFLRLYSIVFIAKISLIVVFFCCTSSHNNLPLKFFFLLLYCIAFFYNFIQDTNFYTTCYLARGEGESLFFKRGNGQSISIEIVYDKTFLHIRRNLSLWPISPSICIAKINDNMAIYNLIKDYQISTKQVPITVIHLARLFNITVNGGLLILAVFLLL